MRTSYLNLDRYELVRVRSLGLASVTGCCLRRRGGAAHANFQLPAVNLPDSALRNNQLQRKLEIATAVPILFGFRWRWAGDVVSQVDTEMMSEYLDTSPGIGDGGVKASVQIFYRQLHVPGGHDFRLQFATAIVLVILCGVVNKMQLFPMNFIAGPSRCETVLAVDNTLGIHSDGPLLASGCRAIAAAFRPGWDIKLDMSKTNQTRHQAATTCAAAWPDEPYASAYMVAVNSVVVYDPDCVAKREVDFVVGSYVKTTSYLATFGLTKAIMNFATGVLCDRYGRKYIQAAGWLVAIPMPIMVIWAQSWAVVASTNILLGLQQAICWSDLFVDVCCTSSTHDSVARWYVGRRQFS
eukprot:SAG31_NODE_2857_length_4991_cov_51.196443_2_plen_353_part_00